VGAKPRDKPPMILGGQGGKRYIKRMKRAVSLMDYFIIFKNFYKILTH